MAHPSNINSAASQRKRRFIVDLDDEDGSKYLILHCSTLIHPVQHLQRLPRPLAGGTTKENDPFVQLVATRNDEETASYLTPTIPLTNQSERRRGRDKTYRLSWTIWISTWKVGLQLKMRRGDSGEEGD